MLVSDFSRVYRMFSGSRRWKILACLFMPGLQAVKVYRFGHWLLDQPQLTRIVLRPLYMLLYYRTWRKWGIDISHKAEIGPGFLIGHFGGIFIGPATIGKNCTIGHDTTIGVAGSGQRLGLPVIGDNVRMAPGVVIAGKIRIGDNARIGANAVVYRDVPDNALVQLRSPQVVIFNSLYGTKAPNQLEQPID